MVSYATRVLVVFVLSAGLVRTASPQIPETLVRVVTENFHGKEIGDPYRWLENLKDPEVQTWLKAQNEHTRRTLDALPDHSRILGRIRDLDSKAPPQLFNISRDNAGRYYYYKGTGASGTPRAYVLDPKTGAERLLIDPDKLGLKGVNGLSPSPDGRYVAFRVRGVGRSQMLVIDTATRELVGQPVTNILGFSGLDWDSDSKSVFLVKMPPLRPDMKPAEAFLNGGAYRHKVTDGGSNDEFIMQTGESGALGLPETSWPFVFPSPDGKYLFVWVEDGARTGHALYVAKHREIPADKIAWRKLTDFNEDVTNAVFHGDSAYVTTAGGENGKPQILRISVENGTFKTAESIVLPTPGSFVTGISAAADALYITATEGFSTSFYRVPYGGRAKKIELPVTGAVKPLSITPDAEGGLFAITAWTRPSESYRYNPKHGWRHAADLQAPTTLGDSLGLTSETVNVRSHDGVEIPMTIIHRRGLKLDSKNPVYLTGYGSYGAGSFEPSFDNVFVPWFEEGGIYAIAHVRGGGEYGEEWHKAGSKDKKRNTWLDFIACAEHLVAKKYTSPEHLAGGGISAGGILIGRAITERPDLFRAALISVGTTDMLRAEYQMNGPANVVEFGTVKDKTSFELLLEMSTYHHVREGVKYPAILVSTGMRDTNVDVWQPAKITARFQSVAKDGARPVLLRVDPEGGHDSYGSTRGQIQELRADQLAFMLWQLRPPRAARESRYKFPFSEVSPGQRGWLANGRVYGRRRF